MSYEIYLADMNRSYEVETFSDLDQLKEIHEEFKNSHNIIMHNFYVEAFERKLEESGIDFLVDINGIYYE